MKINGEYGHVKGSVNITGYDTPVQTPLAWSITTSTIDGYEANTSAWLPRSIARNVSVRRTEEIRGIVVYEFSAEVPAWWIRKNVDLRPSWQKQGLSRAPAAAKPW